MPSMTDCTLVFRGNGVSFAVRGDAPIDSVTVIAERDDFADTGEYALEAGEQECVGNLQLRLCDRPERITIAVDFADGGGDSCSVRDIVEGRIHAGVHSSRRDERHALVAAFS